MRFFWSRKKRADEGEGGSVTLLEVVSLLSDLDDGVKALSGDLRETNKRLEAVRRKVYRDDEKLPDDGAPTDASLANFLANAGPGAALPSGLE